MQSDSDPSYFRLIQMQNEMIILLLLLFAPACGNLPQLKVEAVRRHPPDIVGPAIYKKMASKCN